MPTKQNSTSRLDNTSQFPVLSKPDSISRLEPYGPDLPRARPPSNWRPPLTSNDISNQDGRSRQQTDVTPSRAPESAPNTHSNSKVVTRKFVPRYHPITWNEVSRHKSKNDLWLVIRGQVYNVTDFVDEHPGGEEVLLDVAGQDATQAFEDVEHSEQARAILGTLFVGLSTNKDNTKSVDYDDNYDREQYEKYNGPYETSVDRAKSSAIQKF
jgi:cytochrome b involved in lipid metabolism